MDCSEQGAHHSGFERGAANGFSVKLPVTGQLSVKILDLGNPHQRFIWNSSAASSETGGGHRNVDLRGPAVRTKRPTVFDRHATLFAGMIHEFEASAETTAGQPRAGRPAGLNSDDHYNSQIVSSFPVCIRT